MTSIEHRGEAGHLLEARVRAHAVVGGHDGISNREWNDLLAQEPVHVAQVRAHLGLDAGFCRRYLENIIRFDLGPHEQAGLHHYYMLACELGLARKGVTLEFYDRTPLGAGR